LKIYIVAWRLIEDKYDFSEAAAVTIVLKMGDVIGYHKRVLRVVAVKDKVGYVEKRE
jgi:hypothetical protein